MIRRMSYNEFGGIDCEVEHPVYGWIPFTASPSDHEPLGREVYAKCVSGEFGVVGEFIAPVVPKPTQEEIIAEYELELDNFLDGVAQSYRFKDRRSLAQRAAAPPDTQWQALGYAFFGWMEGCNTFAYALLNQVIAGEVPMPTKEEFIASLPAFVWSTE